MDAKSERDQAQARKLLDLGEPYLSPTRASLLRAFIEHDEWELALDEMLADLLRRGEPLPSSFVTELTSRPDLILDLDGQIQERLTRLAGLAS